jgi:ribosomal protein L27
VELESFQGKTLDSADHTLFALKPGKVKFGSTRKIHFNGKTMVKKNVHVE